MRIVRWRGLPLAVLLAVQVALSLRLIWSNTAFSDEALYLWAGHAGIAAWLHGTLAGQSFSSYFSGAPVIYPPVGALADTIGGLAGARLLSLACMLGATTLLYLTTSRLFSRIAAVSGAAVLVLLGPVQFLSALATYDAMAVFLLALAAYLVVRSAQAQAPAHGELLLAAAGLALALADAAKYATALWDAVVIALAVILGMQQGWFRAAFRGGFLAVCTAIPIILGLLAGGSAYISGITSTTVERQVAYGDRATAALVLHESVTWIWPVLILAVAAVAVSFTDTVQTRLLCCVSAAAVVLAPLHQAQIGTDASLYKHVAFGAWFGAVAAGYVLARGVRFCQSRRWLAIAAAVAGVAGIAALAVSGVSQVTVQYTQGWPDTAQTTADLGRLFPASRCPCLAMSSDVADYYLLGRIPLAQDNFSGPFYFEYQIPGASQVISGTPAYLQAIRDHYFRVVEIDPYPGGDPALALAVTQAMAATPGYQLADTLPRWDGYPAAQIWRYVPLTFDDEFSGRVGRGPDPAKWSYDLGAAGYGPGQLERYTRSRANCYLDDGHLIIAVTRAGGTYQSARLVSRATFTQGVTIEARIRLDAQPGVWPAWWLLAGQSWPGGGTAEVDMLERYGRGVTQTTVYNPAGTSAREVSTAAVLSAAVGWHIYEVQWTASGFTFYRDGHRYLTVTRARAARWGYSPGAPMHMILDVAVGGIAGIPPTSAHFPATMAVDWVRAWQ